jgi:hypothetical protein
MSKSDVAADAATVKTQLQELGDALDQAEASDPSLRPRDGRNAFNRHLRTANWEGSIAWVVPQHSAVRAYWFALRRAMGKHIYVEGDLRTCRRNWNKAVDAYDDLTTRRDSGYFISDLPSLRAILDARAAAVESYIILEQVFAQAQYLRQIKQNKAAPNRLQRFKRRHPEAYAEMRAKERRRWI